MRKIMNENESELNEETIKEIQRSREEFEKGKYYTLEEVKKEIK